MTSEKKSKTRIYFWLKLDKNFFKNLAIKQARRLPGGDNMVVIYQRLMLESLESGGELYYDGVLADLATELALTLDESVENVKMTLAYFTKAGLVQIDEENNAQMLQVPALMASETNWNKYKREKKQREGLENFQPHSNQFQPHSNRIKNLESRIKNLELDNRLDYLVLEEAEKSDDFPPSAGAGAIKTTENDGERSNLVSKWHYSLLTIIADEYSTRFIYPHCYKLTHSQKMKIGKYMDRGVATCDEVLAMIRAIPEDADSPLAYLFKSLDNLEEAKRLDAKISAHAVAEAYYANLPKASEEEI